MRQYLPRLTRRVLGIGAFAATAALVVMTFLPVAAACPEHDGADSGGNTGASAGKASGSATAGKTAGKTAKAKTTTGSPNGNKSPAAASICVGASPGSDCNSKEKN